jgi:hypothetical protein
MADNPDPGGGRWRNNRKNNKSIQQEKRSHEEAKFEGRVPELKAVVNGNPVVYTKEPGRGDQVKRTTKEIGLFLGRTYHNGGVLQQGISTLTTPTISLPIA